MSRNNFLDLRTPLDPRRILFGVVFGGVGGIGPLVAAVFAGGEGAPVGVLSGLLFLAVGLGVAFGRRGVEIDATARTVTTWWGVQVPFRRTPKPLGNPDCVSLSREVRGSGKSRTVVFPIKLLEQSTGAAQELLAPQRYEQSRRMTEQIATFLVVAMHDWSSGARVVREAGTLDEPLRDRLLREEGTVPMPSPTPPGRLRMSRDGDEVLCVLPPSGAGLSHLLGLLMVLVVPFFVARFFLEDNVPWPVRIIALGMMSLPFLFVVPGLLHALLGKDKVWCSSRQVALRPWGSLRGKRTIPAEELEELTVVEPTAGAGFMGSTGGSVVARSDERTLTLGKNLTSAEARWLHDTICHELVPTAFGYRDNRGAARPG
jgi:hypothetical protein